MISLLLLACAMPPLPDPLPREPAVDYTAQWEASTREMFLREHFETRLIVRATLLDEDMVRAQTLTLARARYDSPEQYAQALDQALQSSQGSWSFVFSAYAPPPDRADDFALDDSGSWSLRLTADGRPLRLQTLEEIRDPSPDQEALYPQIDGWARLYSAQFERPSDADHLELLTVGPRGQGAMIWELR